MPNVSEDLCKARTDGLHDKLDTIITKLDTYGTEIATNTTEIAVIKAQRSGVAEVVKHAVTAAVTLVVGFVGIKYK